MLNELGARGIPKIQAYDEIPLRTEYRLTNIEQDLVGSNVNLLN
jgi:DNA-binding HxlR family transcriptional regulator